MRKFRKIIYTVLALLLLFITVDFVYSFTVSNWKTDDVTTTVDNLEVATVVRVVDGDTIVANVNGENQYVRLIGIDAAESVHPDTSKNTEEGREASDYLKSILSEGDVVYLQKDVSETDRYERLLRYVWVEMPSDVWDESEVISKMLNAILIIDGYAEPSHYEPDTSYAEFFDLLYESILTN